jgi:predicted Zn finger-like uncharacterized protein
MPLSVECPECGTRYNVPDKLAGKKARCKKCGATIPIPGGAPVESPIGFAPEDDPMAALNDLARATGEAEAPAPDLAPAPAAPRRRGGLATIPADWTPESVIVEKESAPRSAEGSGRWARKSDSGLARKLVWLVVLAAIAAGGWYAYTNYSGRAAEIIASASNKLKTAEKKPADEKTPAPPKPAPAANDKEPKRAESAEHLRKIFSAVSARAARDGWNWPSELSTLQGDGALTGETLKSPFGPAFASADYVYKPHVPARPPARRSSSPTTTPSTPPATAPTSCSAAARSSGSTSRRSRRRPPAIGAGPRRRDPDPSADARLARPSPQPGQSSVFPGSSEGSPSTPVPNPSAGAGRPGATWRSGSRRRRRASSATSWTSPCARAPSSRAPSAPSRSSGVLVRDPQGDTVELFDGKSSDPCRRRSSPPSSSSATTPAPYALSPDGKLLAAPRHVPEAARDPSTRSTGKPRPSPSTWRATTASRRSSASSATTAVLVRWTRRSSTGWKCGT